MAKKKRSKRLKKLAKVLGAGLAIAGLGRAFANRNARASTNADAIKAMTSDAAYTIPGGDESSFKVQDVKVNVPTKVDTPYISTRMRGKGDMSGTVGQKIRAGLSEPTSVNVDMAEGSPMIDNPYSSRVIRGRLLNRGNTFKSGGRVKKRTGAAKRGFGRAFKGGK